MHLSQLKSRLCEFGLNPREWEINFTRSLGALMHFEIHSTETSFTLEGWATKETWLTLTVLSLE